ncbi:hypothetical protein GSI_08171 [Ganoderma sinense ZZ0214-1]|uniref:RanBD1 domain-containing protein n=1 Tax=Ganoderma sinense ZZ0214-1 TaxID=1077348 RepID=A0A2G8S7H2_9APHY|nr:hypothetical protein GSI_08171 [Ganoderma sinense ZZ0214-1]
MKRAAEKQLVKDGRDDDEEEELEEVSKTGFKKADESVLAGRQIKALPRRNGLAANAASVRAPSATTAEPTPPSKFAGFSGFGAPTNTSAPFSFASTSSAPPAAPKLTPAVPAASPLSFSSTSAQPPLFGGASVSSSASPATKAFASIVGSSSAESIPPTSIEDDQREVDYYKALRGLNVSFLSAVSKAIESDPFVDVADLLERYKALRVSVKSDFDEKARPAAKAPTESKPAEAPKPPPAFSMPAPPASYAGFKSPAPASTAATSPPTGGGFVPKLESSKSAPSLGSPFSFATSKPAAESSATSEPPKSAFSFGSTTAGTGPASGSAFSFGAPSSSSTSIFGSKAPGSSSTSLFPPSTSSTSIFGASSSSTSIFGSGSTFGAKPLAADSSNDADDEKDEKKPSVPFTFTSSRSSTPFGAGTGATTPEKDKDKEQAGSGFSFGSASPGKPSVFSGFGTAKAGSIGNPVGFGFGSPPRTPDIDGAAGSSADSGPVKSLPFSFGAPKASPFAFGSGAPLTTSASGEDKKEGGSSGEGTPAAEEPKPLLASSSAHDLEGEGEEDEETTHEIRSKVFKMTKDKDGKAQWGDLGVGMLRLKRHKETDARRVLLRNSGTGKITINFLVHGGLNPTVSDKVVSFMGHADGASTPYRIRCKTADQAKDLKAALDRELEFVKSKDS